MGSMMQSRETAERNAHLTDEIEPMSPAQRYKADKALRHSTEEVLDDGKPRIDGGGIFAKTYLFRIVVQHDGAEAEVWRRYSDFESLIRDPEVAQSIIKQRGWLNELPPKHMMKSSGHPQVIRERVTAFTRIVDDIWNMCRDAAAARQFWDPTHMTKDEYLA